MKHTAPSLPKMGKGLALLALLLGCVPLFTAGLFQTLQLHFKIDDTLAAGEERLVHSVALAENVKVKKNWVRVSGRLTAPEGEALPERVTLKAEVERLDTGKVIQRLSLKLDVGEDGSFSERTKIKKNLGAGELLSVTLEPSGGDLAKDTEVSVCVDVVKKKKDVAALPPCIEEDDGDGGGGNGGGNGGGTVATTFTELQNGFFTPTCSRAGCHSSGSAQAGLVLEAGQAHGNLVNVRSTQVGSLNRVTPNDPDNSYLIKKLRGDDDIQGTRMPRGGPFLSDVDLNRFISWIDDGAPNN